ncbi:MAG: hypothetical protein WKF87_06715 [Chryseolinea sp.]
MVWLIALFAFLTGVSMHYIHCRRLSKKFLEKVKIEREMFLEKMQAQQEEELSLLMAQFKADLIYKLNHDGIKPISATSQGLADIIILGLDHYIFLLNALPEPKALPIPSIIRGLQDIRNQECMMIKIKMVELREAIREMIPPDSVYIEHDKE